VELRNLINKTKKVVGVWLVFCLVVAGFVGLTASRQAPHFEAGGIVFVGRTAEKATSNFFTYDGFYAQQTAERYTDSVLGIIKSDPLIQAALNKLDLPSQFDAVANLRRNLLVQKVGPQVLSVKVTAPTSSEASNVWQALAEETSVRVASLNETGDTSLFVKPLSVPIVETIYPKSLIFGLATFFGLLVIGILFKAVLIYLRDE